MGINFEDASFSTFRDFPKTSFCQGEVGEGISGMDAMCSRSEVADDVISGTDVDTFRYYAFGNFSSFRANHNYVMRRRRLVRLSPISEAKKQKCLVHHTIKDEALE